MFERVYTNPVAKGEEAKAKDIMRKLFDYYYSHPDKLPADFIPQLDFDGISRINLRLHRRDDRQIRDLYIF